MNKKKKVNLAASLNMICGQDGHVSRLPIRSNSINQRVYLFSLSISLLVNQVPWLAGGLLLCLCYEKGLVRCAAASVCNASCTEGKLRRCYEN